MTALKQFFAQESSASEAPTPLLFAHSLRGRRQKLIPVTVIIGFVCFEYVRSFNIHIYVVQELLHVSEDTGLIFLLLVVFPWQASKTCLRNHNGVNDADAYLHKNKAK